MAICELSKILQSRIKNSFIAFTDRDFLFIDKQTVAVYKFDVFERYNIGTMYPTEKTSRNQINDFLQIHISNDMLIFGIDGYVIIQTLYIHDV